MRTHHNARVAAGQRGNDLLVGGHVALQPRVAQHLVQLDALLGALVKEGWQSHTAHDTPFAPLIRFFSSADTDSVAPKNSQNFEFFGTPALSRI